MCLASFGLLVRRLLSLPLRLLFRRHGPQLEGMDSAFLRHLVLQQGVDEAVARRLHLGLEGFGGDDEAEMRFPGRDALHGLVVRMEVGVVEDLERGGIEGGGDLEKTPKLAAILGCNVGRMSDDGTQESHLLPDRIFNWGLRGHGGVRSGSSCEAKSSSA